MTLKPVPGLIQFHRDVLRLSFLRKSPIFTPSTVPHSCFTSTKSKCGRCNTVCRVSLVSRHCTAEYTRLGATPALDPSRRPDVRADQTGIVKLSLGPGNTGLCSCQYKHLFSVTWAHSWDVGRHHGNNDLIGTLLIYDHSNL